MDIFVFPKSKMDPYVFCWVLWFAYQDRDLLQELYYSWGIWMHFEGRKQCLVAGLEMHVDLAQI